MNGELPTRCGWPPRQNIRQTLHFFRLFKDDHFFGGGVQDNKKQIMRMLGHLFFEHVLVSKYCNICCQVVKILPSNQQGSVVALFFISWAPFHVQRLVYHYHHYFNIQWCGIQTLLTKSPDICFSLTVVTLTWRYRTFNQYLMYVSGCFYFLSSTLNPILYNLMSCKYRKAFRAVLLCAPQQSPKVKYKILQCPVFYLRCFVTDDLRDEHK